MDKCDQILNIILFSIEYFNTGCKMYLTKSKHRHSFMEITLKGSSQGLIVKHYNSYKYKKLVCYKTTTKNTLFKAENGWNPFIL